MTDRIRTTRRKLKTLLRDVETGRFAVPKLQREFVWDGPKAAKLIDSIYRDMPVGLVLIWETPKTQRLYLRQNYHVLPAFQPRNSKVWFLVDGQQRVSVLHHSKESSTLSNARGREIDFSRVVLSLEHEEDGQQVRYRKPFPKRYISLSKILHPQWRFKVGALNQNQLKKVMDCRDKILSYRMNLMFVRMKVKEVRECFLRINTQGMKVTTADAIFTQAEDLDLRDVVHEVKLHLDEPFKNMPELPILWAVAALRGVTEARGPRIQQVMNQIQREVKLDRKLRKKLSREWTRLGRCFGKATDYLRENFVVLSRDYLYSDYLISMLALFYYWNGYGPNQRQKDEIRKWFWATTVGGRYSGRDFYRCVPEDVGFFKRLAHSKKARFRFVQQLDRADIRRAQYAGHTGVGSAFYSLLLLRRPVSILDDGFNEIPLARYSTRANRKDRHHIFPRATLIRWGIPPNRYNSICNICLLTAEENQEIGSKSPRTYLAEAATRKGLFKRKMQRHLIPLDDGIGIMENVTKRRFDRFLKARELMICRALEKEAGMRLFRKDA